MRVLTFTNLLPNQVRPEHGIFVFQRMLHLAQKGVEVVGVAPVAKVPGFGWLGKRKYLNAIPQADQISGMDIYYPRYPLVPGISMPMHGQLMYRGSVETVRKLHAEKPFSLIDAHYVYPDGYAAAMLAEELGIPFVVSARGTDINVFPEFKSVKPKIVDTLKRASMIIAVSRSLRTRMADLGAPKERIRVIGNGIDPTRFSPLERERARLQLGIPLDHLVLLTVASLRRAKGHQQLAKALHQIGEFGIRPLWYLVGEGEDEREIRSSVAQLRLESQVKFVGPKRNQELRSWYSAADLFVLPSMREGWPNVVLESLACGTPVIGSDVGAIPDILSSEAYGLLAKAESSSLAAAIRYGLSKQWDRTRIAKYGASRQWSKVADEVFEVFSDVLSPARTTHA